MASILTTLWSRSKAQSPNELLLLYSSILILCHLTIESLHLTWHDRLDSLRFGDSVDGGPFLSLYGTCEQSAVSVGPRIELGWTSGTSCSPAASRIVVSWPTALLLGGHCSAPSEASSQSQVRSKFFSLYKKKLFQLNSHFD